MEQIPVFLTYTLVFIFGAIIGSFISCFIWRAHNNMKIISGRSQCVHCGRILRFWEEIPILSFIILGGKCHVCKKKIPLHYPHIEFFTGLLFVFIYWTDFRYFQTDIWSMVRDLVFLSFLMLIFVGDLLYETIWPEVIWLGLALGAVFNLALGKVGLDKMVIGAGVALLFFLIQYAASKGRWIGGGDVRLGAMVGVWLGFPEALVAILFAYIIGAFVGVFFLITRRKKLFSALPLGCFLAISTLLAMNHGRQIVDWFLTYWNKI